MQVKIKLKIKILEKVRGALLLIKSSGNGEPCKNKTMLQVKIKEMPTKIKI